MAVNQVKFGDETLIDLTEDTVDADHLAEGYTAHDKAGVVITGRMSSGGEPYDDTELRNRIGALETTSSFDHERLDSTEEYLSQYDLNAIKDRALGSVASINDLYPDESGHLQGDFIEGATINGTNLPVTNYKVEIPLGTSNRLGVVKPYDKAFHVNPDTKTMRLYEATAADITARQQYVPVTLSTVDAVVKAVLCDGNGAEWTGDEMEACRNRLGLEYIFEEIYSYLEALGNEVGGINALIGGGIN